MNWTKLLYVLIIILLYIPMVFLGANVIFTKYTGTDSYYYSTVPYQDCYLKYPVPEGTSTEKQQQLTAEQQTCEQENRAREQQWNQERNAYLGQKYVLVTLFNLAILLFALFVPKLQDSVIMGLFLGSIAATFGATIRYFDTNSKIGFAVVVITFFVMLYFINRKKDSFVDWGTKKKK